MLHPVSLPGTPGIGTIGAAAYQFVDWLAAARQSLWQILPLGPTGYGDSPYASFSAFAGNPLLIDLDMLAEQGLLSVAEIAPPAYVRPDGAVDYGAVRSWKLPLLKTAALRFLAAAGLDTEQAAAADCISGTAGASGVASAPGAACVSGATDASGAACAGDCTAAGFNAFKNAQKYWLDDYAVFMSIKEVYDEKARNEHAEGIYWTDFWQRELVLRDEQAMSAWRNEHGQCIGVYKVMQYFFFDQWFKLKKYANSKGISIIGDIPIFVAADSADVWAHRQFFQLDGGGHPKAVAGVPPDYFSATGQLWGNPLYNWTALKKDGFSWWIERLRSMLSLTDYIRIDHFRGFESYWSVPAGEKTAENGQWCKGPGNALFQALRSALGELPVIAEDLGIITDEVAELRDSCKLPGMKVLQFAFDCAADRAGAHENAFLPHMYRENCVVYTGTHDNDTTAGWLASVPPEQRELVREYLCGGAFSPAGFISDAQLCPALIRLALSSVAQFAVFPLQDIYGLGSDARMNTPSTAAGNWQWRMNSDMCAVSGSENAAVQKAAWLRRMSCLYARNTNMPQE